MYALRPVANLTTFSRACSGAILRGANLSRFVPKNKLGPCRTFSTGLSYSLKTGRDHYLFLQKATSQQKIERTVQQALEESLPLLGCSEIGTTTEQAWGQLRENLKQRAITFPPFTREISEEGAQALFRLFPKKLLQGSSLKTQFEVPEYVTNPTECYWFYHPPSFPFTRVSEPKDFNPSRIDYILKQADRLPTLVEPIEKEIQNWIYHTSSEDGLASLLLATPYLDNDTCVHEIGTWNGEYVFNLLYHSYLQQKVVAGCVGTDINIGALNVADTTARIMGLSEPLVQFHLANALTPVNLSSLGISYQKVLTIALRLLPVLDPQSGRKFLQAVRKSLIPQSSTLILSYALPRGKMYDKNKRIATDSTDSVQEEPFKGGTTFRTRFPGLLPAYLQSKTPYNLVINTYYTPAGFETLAKECGFRIVQNIVVGENSDNDRAVVALSPL